MRKDKGITLIALVISIIVMLILAGVSLNMTIGENGIIKQAQNATYAQSVAIIEEYLNGYYVENYEKMNSNDNAKVVNLQMLQPNWFFSTNLGYVPDSNGNALRLLNKSGLPEDLRSQIVGGDAGNGEYIDYATLNDVYGVTKDLKVYYCSAGLETMIGATVNDLDKDDPNRTVMLSTSGVGLGLSQYDYNGDGKLSSQEAKSIKEVTLSDPNITDISDLGNLPSLETLTLQNLTLDNLKGLEKCGRLYYIFFKSCVVTDYSNMKALSSTLKYLYMYDLDDAELSKVCSNETGIGGKDFEKLEYLAFVGNMSYINSLNKPSGWLNTNYIAGGSKPSNTLTTISALNNLSDYTKSHVKYLSLQNNNITSLSGIEDFTGLLLLRAEYNQLINAVGIENLVNMTYLCLLGNSNLNRLANFSNGSQLATLITSSTGLTTFQGLENCTKLTEIYSYNSKLGNGVDGTSKNSEIDSLYALNGKKSLNVLDLRNNSSIKWVDYLKDDTKISFLYLDGCIEMDMDSFKQLKSIVNNCTKATYPSDYAMGLLDDNLQKFALSDKTISEKEFRALKNKTSITDLYLTNVTITSDTTGTVLDASATNSIINEVLSTMTGLQYLQLYATNTTCSISKLSTIGFVGEGKVTKLIELDLRGTAVTDLSNLNNYSTNLRTLVVDNGDIRLDNMQPTINNVCNYTVNTSSNSRILGSTNSGLLLLKNDLCKKLENLTEIKYLRMNSRSYGYCTSGLNLDLTGCTSLQYIRGYRVFTGANKVLLPASLEEFNCTYSQTKFDFSNCTKLKYISLRDATIFNEDQLEFILNSLSALPLLNTLIIDQVQSDRISNLNALSQLNNSNITEFQWTSQDDGARMNLTDISGLKYLKKLQKLTIQSIRANNLDCLTPVYENGTLISGCPNLQSISINRSQIYDLSPLRRNTNLTSITVTNSLVSSIGGFENLIKLQTLNLTNNSLYDTGNYKNDENEDTPYITAQVLGNLNRNNSLRKLYLSGNQLEDFTELNRETTWTDKSGW